MRVLVVIGHQRADSFCHALAEAAVVEFGNAGHDVVVRDLYAEGFDAILPDSEVAKGARPDEVVGRHCRELLEADVYLIVHPVWWSMPPAIVKGWVDRVFRPGVAYEFGPKGAVGKLQGKQAIVLTTSNTPPEDEARLHGDPLDKLWKTCIFGFCGVDDCYRRNFASLAMSSADDRVRWVEQVRQIVRERYADLPTDAVAWPLPSEQLTQLAGS